MRVLLLAAASIIGLSGMAHAQDVVMRRPIPVDTATATGGSTHAPADGTDGTGDGTGDGSATPTPASGSSGPVYATYSTCYGVGGSQNDTCFKLDNDPTLSADYADPSYCAVAQDAAHRQKLADISTALLGDPSGLLPAGSPARDIGCKPVEVTTGHGWYCYDDNVDVTLQCVTVDKANPGSAYQDSNVQDCSTPNKDGFEAVLGAHGLNAPPYDGSCVKPVYGLSRVCGYTGTSAEYQAITFTGQCFGLNPVSGQVSAAQSYQCQNDMGYSAQQVAQLDAAGLSPGGLPNSQYGPDGQPCTGSDTFSLSRLLKTDETSAPTAPDGAGACSATRSLTYQMVCRSGNSFAPDISSCQHQVDLWTQEIAAAVPSGGTLSSDHYTTTPVANAYYRDYSITYPTDCN